LKVFSGYWSDRLGKRKALVVSGYAISSVAKAFFPFVKSWIHLVALRPIERVGKGLRTAPRDALIADSSAYGRMGRSFGIHRALDTSGAILGSVLAFIFVWFFGFEFRMILLIAALLGFMALVPLIFVREVRAGVRAERSPSLSVGLRELEKPFKVFVAITTIFALGNFSYMFFILKAWRVFQLILPEKMANSIPILLYIIFNISYALLSIPIGNLSDKVGKKRILSIGYLIFSLTCLGFTISSSIPTFILFFLLYGLFQASVDAVQRAYASDLASERWRGTALGTFHTSIGLATLPASAIAGFLWDINPNLTFIYGAVMAFIASILLMTLADLTKPNR